MVSKIFVTLAISLGLFSGRLSAVPQDSAVVKLEAVSFGDWHLRCQQNENLPPCEISQSAKNNKTNEQFMVMSIAHAGKNNRYGIQFLMPLGIRITEGSLLRLDGKVDVSGLAITRCEAQGCFIEGILDENQMSPFLRANNGIIAVVDRNNSLLVLPISFVGLKDAVSAMTKRNIAWAKNKSTP